MQDNENQGAKLQSNYYYGGYINYKAFRDYHTKFDIDDKYLSPKHCMLLAFIIDKYYKDLKMPHITKDGCRYVLMNTNFIENNLIYIDLGERSIKDYMSLFNKLGLIDIEVRNNNSRYVYVNGELIKLCYEKHYTLTPVSYMKQNVPGLWKAFVNEWEPYFNSKEDFKKFVDDFNDTRSIDELNYNSKEIYEHLIRSVKYKIYGKGSKRGLRVS